MSFLLYNSDKYRVLNHHVDIISSNTSNESNDHKLIYYRILDQNKWNMWVYFLFSVPKIFFEVYNIDKHLVIAQVNKNILDIICNSIKYHTSNSKFLPHFETILKAETIIHLNFENKKYYKIL
jgi:Na+-transporting NADH:ubiquinone oxidoreductase subunit NqrB